jgi:3-oxoadipate enol-lactonase
MPTIQLEDVSLYFEEAGQGAPVLLLHGLGSSCRDWELVSPALSAYHRVIALEVRGHGRSDKPAGPYGVPLHARDVAAFCQRLGLDKVSIVGLSMGGMIAFELAVQRPDLVRSLVIINSGPDMVPRTPGMWLALKLRVLLLQLFGPRRLAALIARKLFPKPEQEALRQQVREHLGQNDRDVYLRATRGLIGWTVLPHIGEISCPVLVLASDRDYTPLSAKQAYVARLKDARLEEIKDSGHAAPLDQPEQVTEHVIRFLRSLPA